MKRSELEKIIEEEIYSALASRGVFIEQDDEPRVSDREKALMQRLAQRKAEFGEELPSDISLQSLKKWLSGDPIGNKNRLSVLRDKIKSEPSVKAAVSKALTATGKTGESDPKIGEKERLAKSLGIDASKSKETPKKQTAKSIEKPKTPTSKPAEKPKAQPPKPAAKPSNKKPSTSKKSGGKQAGYGKKFRKGGEGQSYKSAGTVPQDRGRTMTPDQIRKRESLGKKMLNAMRRGGDKNAEILRRNIKAYAKDQLGRAPSRDEQNSFVWAMASDWALKGIDYPAGLKKQTGDKE